MYHCIDFDAFFQEAMHLLMQVLKESRPIEGAPSCPSAYLFENRYAEGGVFSSESS